MPDVPMRFLHFDVSKKESYSLDTLGKHGFGAHLGFPLLTVVPQNTDRQMVKCLASASSVA